MRSLRRKLGRRGLGGKKDIQAFGGPFPKGIIKPKCIPSPIVLNATIPSENPVRAENA